MSSTVVRRRTVCRLCESRDLELMLKLEPTPLADAYVSKDRVAEHQDRYPLDLYLCRACGHAQLLDVVDARVLFREYRYETASSPGLVEHFRRYAEDVVRSVRPPPGSLVVEIGSNDGTLLRFFQERGLRVLGVDAARGIAKRATERGIETLPEFFSREIGQRIRRERGAASIVAANNVFAHADDLCDVAEGIREVLADDGVFVFEVSYLADLINNMVFDFIYHEHLCYHSVKALQPFLRRHGMVLVDSARVPLKGGSLRGIARPATQDPAVSETVRQLLGEEERLGLDRRDAYVAFERRIGRVRAEVRDTLATLQAQGKSVAGYGASATTTTLIYHFEIGEAMRFIVDDNPDRHNLFSPGYHIPVVSPDALYERRPDAVVILAWRFASDIVRKHQRFLDEGGQFIVPLPAVRIHSKGAAPA